jgi:putative hydrolase
MVRPTSASNLEVARMLREAADLLEQQGAEVYRINAFRRAAATVAQLGEDIAEIAATRGVQGLVAIPTIGAGIAAAIVEIVATGRWSRLERLRGELDAVALFRTIPGVGPELAERIHDALHVDTLEGLESATLAGRLRTVPGVGPRREAGIRVALAGMLGRAERRLGRLTEHPPVEVLLEVDRAYRSEASAGRLPRIAPRRFNPRGEATLPILHTTRGEWHFTALYSNTARAHQLGRTRDWVVIYFYDDHHREGQVTVVTETRGVLDGRRVIRGLEPQCERYYDRVEADPVSEVADGCRHHEP